MNGTKLVFGYSVEQAVQHIVGKAFATHTPEAMREASHKLHGIATLLVFMEQSHIAHGDALVRIMNERQRCERSAELIAEGKL